MKMTPNQKSVRNGIEDFLCPFETMYITQGSNGQYSHQGIMAHDVRGKYAGVRYLIYAPCDIVCVRTYPETGQAMWQSKNKVRFANGRIDYATFMTAHDDSMDAYVGREFSQGDGFFQMGKKGNATGVHTHFECSQSNDTSWWKNGYGNWQFNNEYDPSDCYFVDNTNIIEGYGLNWRTTADVPAIEVTPNVERDEYKDQIEVLVPELRVRTQPSLSAPIIGYANIGFYNFYETAQADDYGWYRIADNQWIAYNPEWENVYPAKPKTITLDILDEKDGYVLVDLGKVYIKNKD